MDKNVTYLACPFKHDDLAVEKSRFLASVVASHWLMRKERLVFSPLMHGFPMTFITYGMGPSELISKSVPGIHVLRNNRWEEMMIELGKLIIEGLCVSLTVLTIDGWQDSKGVQSELRHAGELLLPIFSLDPTECGISRSFPHVGWPWESGTAMNSIDLQPGGGNMP
jgi:hypothetical protein